MRNYAESNGSTGSGMTTFVIGLCCGAAIGAALALLYAPKRGVEMRQTLADRTQRLRRAAGDSASRVREQASHLYSGAAGTVNTIVERGRDALEVGKEAFRKTRPHDGPAGDMGPMA
jgi:gas vesicle protein